MDGSKFKSVEMVKFYALFSKGFLEKVLIKLQIFGVAELFDVKDEFPQLVPLDDKVEEITKDMMRAKELVEMRLVEGQGSSEKVHGQEKPFIEIVKEPTEQILTEVNNLLDPIESDYLKLLEERNQLIKRKDELSQALLKEDTNIFKKFFLKTIDKPKFLRIKALRDEEREILSKILETENKIKSLGRENYQKIISANKKLQNLAVRAQAISNLGATPRGILLGCWVPKKELKKVEMAVDFATNNSSIQHIREPDTSDSVPMLLQKSFSLKLYELFFAIEGRRFKPFAADNMNAYSSPAQNWAR